MERNIEISLKTIFWAVGIVLGLLLLVRVWDVIVVLFVAFLFSSAISPLVGFLERRKVPRTLSIPLVFLTILSILVLAGVVIIPPLVSQLFKFLEKLPSIIEKIVPVLGIDIRSFSSQITLIGQNLFKVTTGVFSNVFSIISVFVLTFYLLFELRYVESAFKMYLGEAKGKRAFFLLKKIEEGLGSWARGQFVLCFIIGLATYIGLMFLGVDYALPLAIIAGILEMVPTIGPIISAIPAVLVAASNSGDLAALTVLLYFIIQQAENNLIVPFVMKKATGIPPLFTIIAIMIGGNIAGAAGMLLAVPVIVIIHTAANEVSST